MKFLLEFMPCCGSQRTRRSEAAEPPGSEETRSLVRPQRRRKRGRGVGPPGNAATAAEWKPSLSSISEDTAVKVKVKAGKSGPANGAGGRQIRRKSSGGGSGSGRVHVRTHSNDFGRSQFEMIIPAFSPSPFMF